MVSIVFVFNTANTIRIIICIHPEVVPQISYLSLVRSFFSPGRISCVERGVTALLHYVRRGLPYNEFALPDTFPRIQKSL